MPLRVLTWNINGIRAVKGKSTKQLLDSLKADIICLQETKVTRDMLDEPVAIVEGYDSYFSFSRKRTGYSGTASYCSLRACPVKAEEGLSGRLSTSYEGILACYGDTNKYSSDLEALDAEGRCIITLHQIRLPDAGVRDVAIINVYVPRAGDKEDRLEYKLKFLTLLQSRAEALLEQKIHVIVLGDLNLTHRKIDNCDPDSDGDFKIRSSRIWMNEFLETSQRDSSLPKNDSHLARLALPNSKGGQFSDVYRQLHPDQENAFTNWNSSTDARKTNYGRRLDYILIDTELARHVSACEIMAEVEGSDHCPVVVTLNCDPVLSTTTPQLCSKYMPEFRGQQQKLSSFFSKSIKQEGNNHNSTSLSSSPEAVQGVTSFALIRSSSNSGTSHLSQTVVKKNTKDVKLKVSGKRNATGQQQNLKRLKTSQDETVTKQASLKSFFSKVQSSEETVTESRICETIDSSQIQHVHNDCVSDTDSSVDSPTGGGISTFSSSDPGQVMHSSVNPLIFSESQADYPSQHSCAEEINLSMSVVSALDSGCQTSTATPSLSSSDYPAIPVVKGTSQMWKSLLTGPPPPPLCPGHKEPCILKTVNKKGPNKNKKFYVCARPEGASGNPENRCNFFRWFK